MNKVDHHKSICESLNALYARKNADYGDSFGKSYKEYGMTMACIRLEDKLNRLKALSKQDAQVKDESIADTLMDLANYAIMTLALAYIQQLERERDAAVDDMTTVIYNGAEIVCQLCKHKDEHKCAQICGFGFRGFEWRGVKEE